MGVKKRAAAGVGALALGVSMLGCGGAEAEKPASGGREAEKPASGGLSVSLGEWFVEPAQDSTRAGEVTFSPKNDGQVEHEFEVIRTDTPPGKFPIEGKRANVDKVGEEIGEVHGIAPDGSTPLKVSLEPGKYVLICNFPGHYKAGMFAGFTVE